MSRGSYLINKRTERLVRSGKKLARAPDRSVLCARKKRDKKERNNMEKETDKSRE